LKQALLFQAELANVIATVTEMRESVTEIADFAAVVNDAIHTNVVCVANEEEEEEKEGGIGEERNSSISRIDGETEQEHQDTPSEEDPSRDSSTLQRHESNNESLEEEQATAKEFYQAFLNRNLAKRRYHNLNAFLEKFEMSHLENSLLETYNFDQVDVDASDGLNFLDALDKVRTIRSELSKTLFNGDGSAANMEQQLGATSALRMMEALAQKQERAYERLYHFLQSHLNLNVSTMAHVPISSAAQRQPMHARMQHNMSAVDDDETMDERLAHPFVKRALRSLSHVPSFYNHCLELIAGSRRAEVTRRFLLALTSGYNGAAPIEMRAHDPVSYVGDMLAFVFRSLSVESDLALGLFASLEGEGADGAEGLEVGHKEDGEEGDGDLSGLGIVSSSPQEMLAHSMSGISRPLKSRISQVVTSLARRSDEEESGDVVAEEGGLEHMMGHVDDDMDTISASARNRIAALYSVCGLLLFYHSAMGKTMEKLLLRTGGHQSLNEVEAGEGVHTKNTGSGKVPALIGSTLECLNEASEAFAASLKVHGAMLRSYASMTDETEASLAHSVISLISESRGASPGFAKDVISCHREAGSSLSLEFLCNTIIDSAMSSCETLEDILILKAGLDKAKKAGLAQDCASHWETLIQIREKSVVNDLIVKATTEMLRACGLGATHDALMAREKYSKDNPLASYPGLSQHDLELAMKVFYSSLFSPPLPAFNMMKDPELRNASRAKTAANVVEAYKKIYDAVTGEGADDYDLTFLGHNPDQVKTLLSV